MQSFKKNITVIILAAGMGTRMKSGMAKVLHKILGKPMVLYVVETAKTVAGNNIILVIGNQADKVRNVVSREGEFTYAVQKKQMGTGHAVLCAMPYVPDCVEDVVILCGDVPLLGADTIMRLVKNHADAEYDMTILAVKLDDPSGYGRIVFDANHNVTGIVEDADATEEQKKIQIINTGVYCIKKDLLLNSLCRLKSNNVQEELYITDLVDIAYKMNKNIGMLLSKDYQEVTGVNTPMDLIKVERILGKQLSQVK